MLQSKLNAEGRVLEVITKMESSAALTWLTLALNCCSEAFAPVKYGGINLT